MHSAATLRNMLPHHSTSPITFRWCIAIVFGDYLMEYSFSCCSFFLFFPPPPVQLQMRWIAEDMLNLKHPLVHLFGVYDELQH